MSSKVRCDEWHGCYNESYQGVITPESYSHPAKFSYSLIKRIVKHALEEGWIRPGSLVIAPFGGIGSGGIVCAYNGITWCGVELEERFCKLTQQNFELHRRIWEGSGLPMPHIIQGDSRQLRKVLEKAEPMAAMKSPPFMENNVNIGAVGDTPAMRQQIHNSQPRNDSYGTTPGQLGAMPHGTPPTAMVSSPPYCGGAGIVGSGGATHQGPEKLPQGCGDIFKANGGKRQDYGTTPGQLGIMPDGVVSSPPWENQEPSHAQNDTPSKRRLMQQTKLGSSAARQGLIDSEYGTSAGQIGNTIGSTFWDAAALILREVFAILKPEGHAIFVLKDYVRNKKIVPFTQRWVDLCVACGFVQKCHHKAMMIKEVSRTNSFLDGEVSKKSTRKSFFRILNEKRGAPSIDWESVVCLQKPG